MADPRDSFVDSVSLVGAEVLRPPGFIFFCGGPMQQEPAPAMSARDFVIRRIPLVNDDLAGRIRLAEEIQDWMTDGVYKELVTFERDIADLASLIVVFVESEGAIAELGVFSQVEVINEKLLVFLQSQYHHEVSYIRLGPVKFMEEKSDESVSFYPWTCEGIGANRVVDAAAMEDCFPNVLEDLLKALERQRRPRKFDANLSGHRMFLMADLLDQMIALTRNEIAAYLCRLLKQEIEVASIKRYLFILRKLGFVEEIPYGNEKFYVLCENKSYMKYSLEEGAKKTDRQRLRFEIADHYRKASPQRIKVAGRIEERD